MKSIAYRSLSLAAAALLSPAGGECAKQHTRWEGFYAGVNAGGIWSSTAATIGENNAVGGFNGSGSGFMGGAQAGYNYLLGPVLLGGEVDFQGSTVTSGVPAAPARGIISAKAAMPWFSTFRARVGYPSAR